MDCFPTAELGLQSLSRHRLPKTSTSRKKKSTRPGGFGFRFSAAKPKVWCSKSNRTSTCFLPRWTGLNPRNVVRWWICWNAPKSLCDFQTAFPACFRRSSLSQLSGTPARHTSFVAGVLYRCVQAVFRVPLADCASRRMFAVIGPHKLVQPSLRIKNVI